MSPYRQSTYVGPARSPEKLDIASLFKAEKRVEQIEEFTIPQTYDTSRMDPQPLWKMVLTFLICFTPLILIYLVVYASRKERA